MASAVGDQLKKIKEETEQRRLEELTQSLVNLKAVREAIKGFDLESLSTSAFLEVILAGAIANKVSDIHLEPESEAVRIRFRVDGALKDIVADFAKRHYKSILSRVKLLSGLKIDVITQAQDGRFTVALAKKNIELRVSVVPSEFGEAIVMRILDPEAMDVPLEQLGLREDDLVIINEEINQPNGMILNTGPTGSGKTTTLYSFLKKRSTPEIKIITIEDPIEYNLQGVEQTQVNKESGYTFASGLRAALRQDPDVILVGEIRDGETADAAVQASLTGHLVFSTVHANQAAGAIPRLISLKIAPASIGPALNLIMAQRLVRKLCQNCRRMKEIDEELTMKLGQFLEKLPERINKGKYSEIKIYEAAGCEACGGEGYKGRIGVFELLRVDKEIEALIEKEAGETEIQDFALKEGMLTMQQDGFLKVLEGVTTLEEVEKITGKLQI